MLEFCNQPKKWLKPIYKVYKDTTVYIFLPPDYDIKDAMSEYITHTLKMKKLSRADLKTVEKKLKDVLGTDWEQAVEINGVKRFKFIDVAIYDDDQIYQVRKKITDSLNIPFNDVYMWCQQEIKHPLAFWTSTLNNIFSENIFVQLQSLAMIYKNLTGTNLDMKQYNETNTISKQEALELLESQDFKVIYASMCFQYVKNKARLVFSYNPAFKENFNDYSNNVYQIEWQMNNLVESCCPYFRDIFLIVKKDKISEQEQQLYFPEWRGRIIMKKHDIYNVYNNSQKHFTNDCYLTYLQIRNTDITTVSRAIDIDGIFYNFDDLNMNIPFMKKSNRVTGNLIKLYQDVATISELTQTITQWCKTDIFKRSKPHDYILVKVLFDEKQQNYATITLLSSGTIDLKIKFGIDVSYHIDNIRTFIEKINEIILTLSPDLIPFDKDILHDSGYISHTQIVGMSYAGIFKPDIKVAKHESIITALNNGDYSEHFAFLTDQGKSVHMVYKHMDGFNTDEAITHFIAHQLSLKTSIAELQVRIPLMFGISEANTVDMLKTWKQKLQEKLLKSPFASRFYGKKIQYVNIKLKQSVTGYRIAIGGATSKTQYDRVMRSLECLLQHASTIKAPGKQDVKPPERLDNIDIDVEDFEDEVDDFDGDLDAYLERLEKKDVKNENDSETESDEGVKEKGMSTVNLLSELIKHDRRLFKFAAGTNFKSYAKTCQKSAARQPVVVTKDEFEKLDKSSFLNFINYGSTPEKAAQNYYICPDVWCPKSRVSINKDVFEEKGKKCPAPGETANEFYNHTAWLNTENQPIPRYVKLMTAKRHPDLLQMPCCYKRDEKQGEVDDNADLVKSDANMKYIVMSDTPIEDKRFAILPPSLSKFLGNKNSKGGLMTTSTNMFVRMGIPIKRQSFLECMSKVLENGSLKSDVDIINSIVHKTSMELFLSLDNGLLAKKFMSYVHENDIYDQSLFNKFRQWYATNNYQGMFDVNNVTQIVVHSNLLTFANYVGFAKNIRRDFVLYRAYTAFQEYIQNDNIVKTHEFLYGLFSTQLSWLNKRGLNIIIIEIEGNNVFFPCANHFKPDRPIVVIVKIGNYYEPVVHVQVHNHGVQYDITFNQNKEYYQKVKALLHLQPQCSNEHGKDASELLNVLNASTNITHLVLDYDLQVCGIVIGNPICFIPFHHSMTLHSTLHLKDIKYTYICDIEFCLKENQKPNIKEEINKVLKHINDSLPQNTPYYELGSNQGNNGGLLLNWNDSNLRHIIWEPTAVPILIHKYHEDFDTFISWKNIDARKHFSDESDMIEKIGVSLWNEIIKYVSANKNVLSQLYFIRHAQNPLSNKMKYNLIQEILSHGQFVDRYKISTSEPNKLHSFHSKLCSDIDTIAECAGQCKWLENDDKTRKYCTLHIPSKWKVEVMNKLMSSLVNPFVQIRPILMGSRTLKKIILISDTDIRLGRLNNILGSNRIDVWGFERQDTNLDTQMINKVLEDINEKVIFHVEAKLLKNIPIVSQEFFKGFKSHPFKIKPTTNPRIDDIIYDSNSIYEFFTMVKSMINNDKTDLKKLVVNRVLQDYRQNANETTESLKENPSFVYCSKSNPINEDILPTLLNSSCYFASVYELNIIALLLGINIVIMGRKCRVNPDNHWCLGKIKNAQYIVILKQDNNASQHRMEYTIVLKNSRFLFEESDFDDAGKAIIAKKCQDYVLKQTDVAMKKRAKPT
jgi:hypothetical protein